MILITGLTGTSGSAFYDVLCREYKNGNFNENIKVVVRKTTDLTMFNNTPLNIELVTGDIRDKDFLIDAMKNCDMVFHISNKNHTSIVSEAILSSPNIKKAIFISSTIIYSKYYRKSKLNEFEPKIRKEFEIRGIRYCFIRPTMIFGTANDRNISSFIKWFLKYPVFPIVKKGMATIQPVSRLDLAEAYFLILKNFDTLKENDYIVSGKDKMTLIEMFRIITKLENRKVLFINVPFCLAKFTSKMIYTFSFHKCDFREKVDRLSEDRAYDHCSIENELGYKPLSFEDRVKPLIDKIMK